MKSKISKRVSQVNEYYFSLKLEQIRKMNESGSKVLNLGIGSPILSPAPEVLQSLNDAAQESVSHQYQGYRGVEGLRAAFSDWYSGMYKVKLDHGTEVLPLIGSKEGIMHIAMAFLDAGDEVLVPNPGYPVYEACSKLAGATVRYYNLRSENDWLIDTEEISKMKLDKVKILWLTNPHMPTGISYPAEQLLELIALCRKHGIILVSDVAYSMLAYPESLSLMSLNTEKDVVIELNSLSKSHNMAGWRVGVAAGSAEHISNILRFKSNMDSGMFRPVQIAAISALQLKASWYMQLCESYMKKRKMLENLLHLLDCRVIEKQTGLFIWSELPESAENSIQFTDEILDKYKLFITPGVIFGSNGDRFVRTSLCVTDKDVTESLRRVENDVYKLYNTKHLEYCKLC